MPQASSLSLRSPRSPAPALPRIGGLIVPLLLLALVFPATLAPAQQPAPPTHPQGDAPRPNSPSARPLRGATGAAPTLGTGPTCSFDATIYDLRLPADGIGRLDADALSKAAANAEEFEKALAALGTAKPLYRASQSIRLTGDMILIGSEVPVITNTRITDRGDRVNTVQYMSHGAAFSVAGAAAPTGLDLDLSIQVSASSDDGPPVGDKANASLMRRSTLLHKGPIQPNTPFVVISVDAASPDKDAKAVAYIARITLGKPQHPASR